MYRMACEHFCQQVKGETGCCQKRRQVLVGGFCENTKNRRLGLSSLLAAYQAACEGLRERQLKKWSGRRGSNPRQPAWEAGGCKITTCLAQTATTGCLKSASSFLRTYEKSCHMHFSRILAKVFASPGRQVVTRFCTHQHYTLLLEKRQNAMRTLFAQWIYERMGGVASTGIRTGITYPGNMLLVRSVACIPLSCTRASAVSRAFICLPTTQSWVDSG
jgi:hypothetical protein